MAQIICLHCKAPCKYTKDKWWSCPNGHGQRIDAAIPTNEEREFPPEEVYVDV